MKNREKTIAEAVNSVLKQDCDFKFNVIIVDNHSTDGTTRMTVVHTGATPALFQTGIGVVVEGTYGPDGAFHAAKIQAKCASKYEAKPGEYKPAEKKPADEIDRARNFLAMRYPAGFQSVAGIAESV